MAITSTSNSNNHVGNQVPTLLAGLSVVLSMASLLLSYSTWRRQHYDLNHHVVQIQGNNRTCIEEEVTSTSKEATAMTSSCSAQAAEATASDKTIPRNNKPQDTEAPLDNNNTPSRVRATIENQVMANASGNGLTVQPIGVIRSVYKLCVGTPRQGLLAPHARGRIELTLPANAAMDCVQELDQFSHVWILFVFHLNTLSSKKTRNQVSPKIAPPALGGKKVGVLATRSPHRFNPLGMTMARLERVEIQDKKQKQQSSTSQVGAGMVASRVILHLSGLDLVDGTPVLDVKPYVPVYDSVVMAQPTTTTGIRQQGSNNEDAVKLPPWVSEGLATRRSVTISKTAREDLETILQQPHPGKTKSALEFYGHNGESTLEAMDHVLACITEVLSMDVRSSWQTQKARKGASQAERSHRLQSKSKKQQTPSTRTTPRSSLLAAANGSQEEADSVLDNNNNDNNEDTQTCTQQLDNLLLRYTVTQAAELRRSTSEGSGAEDNVCVTSIQLLL